MVLLPEYIFLDVGTEEISFLYYPNPEEGSLSDLMNFFLKALFRRDLVVDQQFSVNMFLAGF